MAEETGLSNGVGGLMLRRACMDAAIWPDDVRVAVNLSPAQFRTGDLLSVVMASLKQSGLAPKRLELEITKTLLLEKSSQVLATLHALPALGARICMDDFGTGYASLSDLRSFPFDKFVRDLATNPDAQAIIRSIVSLGKGLGVTITAEGVETETELSCLRAEGCHEGQGFLFSRARPIAEIVALLQAQRTADAASAVQDATKALVASHRRFDWTCVQKAEALSCARRFALAQVIGQSQRHAMTQLCFGKLARRIQQNAAVAAVA